MLEINVGNITNQDNRKRAKWSMILGGIDFLSLVSLRPYPMVLWLMSISLERPSLTPWISWYPTSSCLLVPSVYHFLQAISLKRLLQWRNCILMKQHGNRDCSKSGSSFFVSSFQSSSSWSLSPNLCNQKGLE